MEKRKNTKSLLPKGFHDWLRKKDYVVERQGKLFYRFKFKTSIFYVPYEDMPENLLLGDLQQYKKLQEKLKKQKDPEKKGE